MFGRYLDGLKQAESLMEKGKFEEALHELNNIEKGIRLNENEKLACMLLTSQIMNKAGHYEKSLMLSKIAFRKSMELSDPFLVVDSTISFLEAIKGLGLLYDASKKDQKEYLDMILRSEEILKRIKDVTKKEKDIRTSHLVELKGIIKHSQVKPVPTVKEKKEKKTIVIPLEKVKGVGKKVEALKAAGITNAVELAYSDPKELVKIKGIGPTTAEKLIETAKELISK
ncbi:MAG: helix-hairpin-helix domain-containing protein [Candidatus Heimdallarchaeaceae archaeon]